MAGGDNVTFESVSLVTDTYSVFEDSHASTPDFAEVVVAICTHQGQPALAWVELPGPGITRTLRTATYDGSAWAITDVYTSGGLSHPAIASDGSSLYAACAHRTGIEVVGEGGQITVFISNSIRVFQDGGLTTNHDTGFSSASTFDPAVGRVTMCASSAEPGECYVAYTGADGIGGEAVRVINSGGGTMFSRNYYTDSICVCNDGGSLAIFLCGKTGGDFSDTNENLLMRGPAGTAITQSSDWLSLEDYDILTINASWQDGWYYVGASVFGTAAPNMLVLKVPDTGGNFEPIDPLEPWRLQSAILDDVHDPGAIGQACHPHPDGDTIWCTAHHNGSMFLFMYEVKCRPRGWKLWSPGDGFVGSGANAESAITSDAIWAATLFSVEQYVAASKWTICHDCRPCLMAGWPIFDTQHRAWGTDENLDGDTTPADTGGTGASPHLHMTDVQFRHDRPDEPF